MNWIVKATMQSGETHELFLPGPLADNIIAATAMAHAHLIKAGLDAADIVRVQIAWNGPDVPQA